MTTSSLVDPAVLPFPGSAAAAASLLDGGVTVDGRRHRRVLPRTSQRDNNLSDGFSRVLDHLAVANTRDEREGERKGGRREGGRKEGRERRREERRER